MTGLPREEYMRQFRIADAVLAKHGYGSINPTRVWACRWPWLYRIVGYKLTLLYDLWLLITRADGIVFLPNWVTSRGANIEKAVSDWFYLMGVSNEVREAIDRSIRELEKQP